MSRSFRLDKLQLYDVAEKQLPYYSSTIRPLRSSTPVDTDGIVVRVIDGKPYDHPVLQAQHMMQILASYTINHDSKYLAEVDAHAARMESYAVNFGGAAFLPYSFPFNLHGKAALSLSAPWYSGMAQGQALGAFSRLARVTGSKQHREFADALFASFNRANDARAPWTPVVDADNALWFEEYPEKTGGSCRALNGHIFAVYGLYDYWQLTQSRLARDYVIGGMSAVSAHITAFRNPSWISHYCLTHKVTSPSYHKVHVGQLYQLFTYTGSSAFAQEADQFIADYPTAQGGGRCHLQAGTHSLRSLSAGGASSSTVVLKQAATFDCDSRAGLAGAPGVYLRLSSGPYKGLWVREVAEHSYITGAIEGYWYAHPRLLQFAQGAFTGHKFGADGTSVQQKTQTLNGPSAAHTSQRLVQNGQLHHKILDGIWNGWWIPDNDRVTLA